MNTKYYFKFFKELSCVQQQRTDVKEAYKEGDELAERLGCNIGVYVFDSNTKQLKYFGTFLGKRVFLDRGHRICNISSDYSEIMFNGKRRKGVRL